MFRDGRVEHATDRNPVDGSALYAEADEAPRGDIDCNHDPVTAEEDGFAAEQVSTPQAILGLGEKGQPGWRTGPPRPRSTTVTLSLSKELAGTGVTSNGVMPGLIYTPQLDKFFIETAQRQGSVDPDGLASLTFVLGRKNAEF
jgi:hypothetical protein